MNLYVSHATSFDFRNELYAVLKNSQIAKDHHLILPHDKSDMLFDTKGLFEKQQADVILAEVSYPSTGQGIELGWANLLGIRIICISKKGVKVSSSLRAITEEFVEYEIGTDMVDKVRGIF